MEKLIQLIHGVSQENWAERSKEAFGELFGSDSGRYPATAGSCVTVRAPEFRDDGKSVPFSALIDPANPSSGPYGGMSFVLFPVEGRPALVSLVVGTQGLHPDEEILGRPGHARKVKAICSWLNAKFREERMVAWAKESPVRIDVQAPKGIQEQFDAYTKVFKRYGNVIYGVFQPGPDPEATRDAVAAMLDLMFAERGYYPLTAHRKEAERIQASYFEHLMPSRGEGEVFDLLKRRKYVILQGPPGTGKTRMALRLLENQYGGAGRVIQFHPSTTYESFVGGLAPVTREGELGFRFEPRKGHLMRSVEEARGAAPEPYLLVVDEINRADLAKVLGEAIYLLEAAGGENRSLELAYDFGAPDGLRLRLPSNLHVLGTMNTADRSIAILDVAIRRRFAFVDLWPQMGVVKEMGCAAMQEAFRKLMDIFMEHASEEALPLVPGHSYFLEPRGENAGESLRTNIKPLLEEYLAQGYVGGFSEDLRAYLQWMESL